MKSTEKEQISGGCRIENGQTDTVVLGQFKAGNRWPKEDRVNWVLWRVRELTMAVNYQDGKSEPCFKDERGKWLTEEEAAGGRKLPWKDNDPVTRYAVWLLHERDGKSWHYIARRFFPAATEEEILGKYESRMCRAYKHVERNHPGSKFYKPKPLRKAELAILRAVMYGAVPIPVAEPKEQDGELDKEST